MSEIRTQLTNPVRVYLRYLDDGVQLNLYSVLNCIHQVYL